MRIFFRTLPVRGSIRPSVLIERSATQRLPAPYASPNGRDANEMSWSNDRTRPSACSGTSSATTVSHSGLSSPSPNIATA